MAPKRCSGGRGPRYWLQTEKRGSGLVSCLFPRDLPLPALVSMSPSLRARLPFNGRCSAPLLGTNFVRNDSLGINLLAEIDESPLAKPDFSDSADACASAAFQNLPIPSLAAHVVSRKSRLAADGERRAEQDNRFAKRTRKVTDRLEIEKAKN